MISRKICTKDVLGKLLHAYGLTVAADGGSNSPRTYDRVKRYFSRHGLRVRLEKTEVMRVVHSMKELYINLGGKKLKQRDIFVYLGGAICGVGSSPILKRKLFGVWLERWRRCSVKEKVKVCSYIAQYPILRIFPSALHFSSLADLFNQTPSQLLWEAPSYMLQLMREDCSYTYLPPVCCQVLIYTAE